MGTNSSIAIQNNDGSIDAVYCHWDGYLDHNGKILFDHYSTVNKVKALISHGDMSCLNKRLEAFRGGETKEGDHCIFYHRDNNENLRIHRYPDIMSWLRDFGQEYNYLFNKTALGGAWFLYDHGGHCRFLGTALQEDAARNNS